MWHTTKSIMAFSCPIPKLDKYYVRMNNPSWVVPLGCHKKEKEWPWIAAMLSHLHFRVYISTEYVRDFGKSNYTKEKKEAKATQSCLTLCDPRAYYSPWNSPGQNTGVGSLSLLQGIFPNPGIKPRSPTLRADCLPAEPQGSPRILEWVAYPFSRGSSQPRNQTWVSCIADGFFTIWATREALFSTLTHHFLCAGHCS